MSQGWNKGSCVLIGGNEWAFQQNCVKHPFQLPPGVGSCCLHTSETEFRWVTQSVFVETPFFCQTFSSFISSAWGLSDSLTCLEITVCILTVSLHYFNIMLMFVVLFLLLCPLSTLGSRYKCAASITLSCMTASRLNLNRWAEEGTVCVFPCSKLNCGYSNLGRLYGLYLPPKFKAGGEERPRYYVSPDDSVSITLGKRVCCCSFI